MLARKTNKIVRLAFAQAEFWISPSPNRVAFFVGREGAWLHEISTTKWALILNTQNEVVIASLAKLFDLSLLLRLKSNNKLGFIDQFPVWRNVTAPAPSGREAQVRFARNKQTDKSKFENGRSKPLPYHNLIQKKYLLTNFFVCVIINMPNKSNKSFYGGIFPF